MKKKVKKSRLTPIQRTELAQAFPDTATFEAVPRTFLKNKDGSITVLINVRMTDPDGGSWSAMRVLRFKKPVASGQKRN